MSEAYQLEASGPEERSQVDRTPPQDMAAEQSVLGAMLLSKDAIADVLESIKGIDFYRPAHEMIFDSILDLYGRGEPADAVTVAAELTRRGEIGRVGGHPYLHELVSTVSIASNASYYAEIVREKAVLRRLVEASMKISQLGYQGTGDVSDIVDRAQQAIYSVTEGKTSEDYKPLSALMESTLDEIEAIGSRGGQLAGVPTGILDLDDLTNGLHPGQMVIVAARPAMGKALALDTPLPTPQGWTTMGDVQVGDQLLDADGRPTTVVAATEVMTDRTCYEITFSDGTTVIADAEHQWKATSRAARRAAAEGRLSYAYPADDLSRLHALVPAAGQITMREAVAEVGLTFRNALQTVGATARAGRAPRQCTGPKRSYLWQAPVYDRPRLYAALEQHVSKPLGSATKAHHPTVVTTEEMARQVRLADGRANWSVDLCAPLDLPQADLPLAPYALGVWLGDGHSASARFTSADPEMVDHLARHGVTAVAQTGLNYGMRQGHTSVLPVLRELEVLGNKHIPQRYLRASIEQRWELLRGLLDTDGTVAPAGCIQVTFTHRQLAEDTRELICSLGIRCGVQQRNVAGRSEASSTAYTLTFTTSQPAFCLERKLRIQRERARPATWLGARSIRSIRKVDSVPVRCVEVDNPEHLYLATKSMVPTHNSTLGLDFARACSIKNGMTSAIFSLEMSQSEIVMRLLSAEAGVPLKNIRNGEMTEEDWARLARKMGEISEAPLYVDDSPNLTMMEIRAKARRLKQRHDLKLVVIDYMQLMTSGKRVESRQLEVSEFSRQIKLLAKELELPVVAISQLNRGPEQRNDKRPMVADLRESGSLEQDADMIILLHREDYYDKDSTRAGEADLIVAKHRNGPTRDIQVAFQGHYSRFVDMQH